MERRSELAKRVERLRIRRFGQAGERQTIPMGMVAVRLEWCISVASSEHEGKCDEQLGSSRQTMAGIEKWRQAVYEHRSSP